MRWTKLLLLLLLAGCGSRDQLGDDDVGMMTMAGTVAKGDPCTMDEECAEPDAICRKGDVCTGTLGPDAFQQECARGGAADCPGLACLGLRDNAQGKTGICTMGCDIDADCGSNAACVEVSAGNNACLTICAGSGDCLNGYVCVMDPEGRGQACFVEPI